MGDERGKDGRFLPGQSGNPAGRPPGIVDRRVRLQKSLMDDADTLLAVARAKALEGDPQMLNLLLSRVMPALRPEGERVQIEGFDPSQPLTTQLEAVSASIANGELTLEQGMRFVEIIERLAVVRAAETGTSGDKELEVIAAFKRMSQLVDSPHLRTPYRPPDSE